MRYRRNNNHRSKQLNPNNDEFWKSRGFKRKPNNWKKLLKAMKFLNLYKKK